MARTISEIYNSIQASRVQNTELSSFENTSKMSVVNSICYIVAAAIWSFENMLDIFLVDVAKDIRKHYTGTVLYYTNMLLKYQSGDELKVKDDFSGFYYDVEDESKKVVKVAIGDAVEVGGFFDKQLVFKVAQVKNDAFLQIDEEELSNINNYMQQIAFAGTNVMVVSRKGDIVVPKLEVVYDGTSNENDVRTNVEKAINEYLKSISFSAKLYPNKLVAAIMSVPGVVDVHDDDEHELGIFVAQCDDNDKYMLRRYVSSLSLYSGYGRQSTGTGEDAEFPKWSESIKYVFEA